jgi:serine/threonine protein kinase
MISGDDYTLKYIDFGFATEKSNGYLTTFLGTPNYAAPELHLKQPYLGVYEDIYSLGVTLFIIVTGHLPFILPLPDDPLYQYIFCVDYINYWRNRKVKVSPSFMELFDNLIAFNPTQRPSISEIRKSKWMQEINWNLLPSLQQEFRRREEIINKKISFCETNENTISRIGNFNNNINADDMLFKIRQEKKIDVINSIKNQLFPNNYIDKRNLDKSKSFKNESNEGICSCQNDNELKCKNENSLVGFIKLKKTKNIKNMNSLIALLRQYLKNEGYKKIKKNMNFLNVEITNGEMDVLLSIEKMCKEIKIKYIIINGNKEDLLNFNKIMKRFKIN